MGGLITKNGKKNGGYTLLTGEKPLYEDTQCGNFTFSGNAENLSLLHKHGSQRSRARSYGTIEELEPLLMQTTSSSPLKFRDGIGAVVTNHNEPPSRSNESRSPRPRGPKTKAKSESPRLLPEEPERCQPRSVETSNDVNLQLSQTIKMPDYFPRLRAGDKIMICENEDKQLYEAVFVGPSQNGQENYIAVQYTEETNNHKIQDVLTDNVRLDLGRFKRNDEIDANYKNKGIWVPAKYLGPDYRKSWYSVEHEYKHTDRYVLGYPSHSIRRKSIEYCDATPDNISEGDQVVVDPNFHVAKYGIVVEVLHDALFKVRFWNSNTTWKEIEDVPIQYIKQVGKYIGPLHEFHGKKYRLGDQLYCHNDNRGWVALVDGSFTNGTFTGTIVPLLTEE